jgi:pimeloyl-ACP methyl ester carboxylesterase
MAVHLTNDQCGIEVEAAPVPLAHEALAVFEWMALRSSDVFRGEGVARGHGEPVIIVPGFLASYTLLHELNEWLTRIGYRVFDPGFDRNAACPDVLLERLERRIEDVAARAGGVRLIGHSLGGSLARAAATRKPSHVAQVITLGSPLHVVRAHEALLDIARLLAVLIPERHGTSAGHHHDATCSCEFAETLARTFPKRIPHTAIFSKRDGVIDWRTARDGDPSTDVEVHSTHAGMIVNQEVYGAIARSLAAVSGATGAGARGARRKEKSA